MSSVAGMTYLLPAPVSQFRDCFGPSEGGGPMGAAGGGAGEVSTSVEVRSCAMLASGVTRAKAIAPLRSTQRTVPAYRDPLTPGALPNRPSGTARASTIGCRRPIE